MKSSRVTSAGSSRGFFILILIAAVIIIVESTGIYLSRESMVREKAKVARLQREISRMNMISPAPTEAVSREIAAVRGQSGAHVDRLRGLLSGGALADAMRIAEIPAERTDAYFDLAAYVEGMETTAEKYGVEIAPDERFGFSEYENRGPDKALISSVFRQRQTLGYLLETLLVTKPQRLLQVSRSKPYGTGSMGRASRLMGNDGFEWDPSLSMKIEGHLRTQAYRISFRGETAVLRSWFNRLALFELPVVVHFLSVKSFFCDRWEAANSMALTRS